MYILVLVPVLERKQFFSSKYDASCRAFWRCSLWVWGNSHLFLVYWEVVVVLIMICSWSFAKCFFCFTWYDHIFFSSLLCWHGKSLLIEVKFLFRKSEILVCNFPLLCIAFVWFWYQSVTWEVFPPCIFWKMLCKIGVDSSLNMS